MKIGTYSYDEYVHLVKSFHGSLAPGLIIGGFIVDLAQKNLPEGEFLMPFAKRPSVFPTPSNCSRPALSATAGSISSIWAASPSPFMRRRGAKAFGSISTQPSLRPGRNSMPGILN